MKKLEYVDRRSQDVNLIPFFKTSQKKVCVVFNVHVCIFFTATIFLKSSTHVLRGANRVQLCYFQGDACLHGGWSSYFFL